MSAVFGVALVALALWIVRRVALGYPGPGLSLLRAGEVATVAAAAEVLFPPGGPVPPSGLDAGVPAYVDRYIAAVPRPTRLLMRALLFLIEHATLVFAAPGRGGRRRFSALDEDQREAVLVGWSTSRHFARRLVFTSLRAMLTMGYFADPAVLRAMGIAPKAIDPPVCEADLLYPRVGASRASIRLSPADLTPPSDGRPLDPEGPLHPAYREAS